MNIRNYTYLLLPLLLLLVASCRQSKYVPQGYYLLDENETTYLVSEDSTFEWEDSHDQIDEYDLESLIRPETNSGLKLWIYNRIDSARYKKQVVRKRKKFKKKNEKRQAKIEKKNQKRIKKAKKRGKTHYKKKTKPDKTPRLGWRNWVIEHWGEAPVILDTSKVSKSKQQMEVFLSQRGFKYAEVSDSIRYDEKKRKAWVTYYVNAGKPYVINSITFDPNQRNKQLEYQYNRMRRKEGSDVDVGDLLDEEKLDDEREHFTKFLKDNAFFGFSKSYVNFIVDTTVGDFKADIVVYIKEKEVADPYNPDTTTTINHMTYYVDEVTYKLHNPDTSSFKDWDAYKKRCQDLGLYYPYRDESGKFYLLDTIFIQDTVINKYFVHFDKNRRKDLDVGFFGKRIDTVINYKGHFIYNETPFLKPSLLDKQNFLEHTDLSRDELNYAKDYYIDRTFKSFLRLDVFSRINPHVEIDPNRPLERFVNVTYDLTPSNKQQFVIEPRATNTASILGISGRISYTNQNLFRSGHQLSFTIESGAESQPLVAGDVEDKKFQFRGLNTFEIGPELTYRIPRFFPMTKKMRENVSKRAYPSTEITSLYNFQKRPEFSRHIAEFNYKWKFSIPPDEIQRVTVVPLIFNYVFLNTEQYFDDLLAATNDPFLINSYSDFLSIGFLNFKHEYTNAALPKHKRNKRFLENSYSNTFDISASGLIVNSIVAMADNSAPFTTSFDSTGKEIFSVPFAQFAKITNTFIYNMYINPKHRIAYRLIMGAGFAYGNGFALPYTQSYTAGGSNDIRAFSARTMAPGDYQAWADPNATETQIGDVKLELNLEWRFKIAGQWNGAVFVDMGNIWKINSENENDPGLFRFSDFYRSVAIGTGFGVRYDLTFLILRLDVSWAVHNPYLDHGERWWNTAINKDEWINAVKEKNNGNYFIWHRPFGPRLNFGIGYPF